MIRSETHFTDSLILQIKKNVTYHFTHFIQLKKNELYPFALKTRLKTLKNINDITLLLCLFIFTLITYYWVSNYRGLCSQTFVKWIGSSSIQESISRRLFSFHLILKLGLYKIKEEKVSVANLFFAKTIWFILIYKNFIFYCIYILRIPTPFNIFSTYFSATHISFWLPEILL